MRGYIRFNNRKCTHGSDTYNTFEKAKEACSADPGCKMFVAWKSSVGYEPGRQHQLCHGFSAVKAVSPGSVVYEKESK